MIIVMLLDREREKERKIVYVSSYAIGNINMPQNNALVR